ncbi:transmembrane signal receptor [Lithospermum erythrorhizon]|uniref:Transmembrane signal receptor n=1 Tax=Lithospermum erythrorhizon TaxID=34254 RepID=A0AAV3R1X1_LITER
MLRKFGLMECNSVNNPIAPTVKIDKDPQGNAVDKTLFKQIVGSLMYLTATRPDLIFVTSLISRYMDKPTEMHMQVAKIALRYVKGTTQLGIHYQRTTEMKGELMSYTDSDYAGDMDDRRSTSGYVFIFSSGAVAWSSKKQPIVTLSTTEAEFVAVAFCTCQAIWMKRVLEDLGYNKLNCIGIKCDNSSTIKLSKNPVMHGRSKHIDIADIMTKPLKLETFQRLRIMLGLKNITELN